MYPLSNAAQDFSASGTPYAMLWLSTGIDFLAVVPKWKHCVLCSLNFFFETVLSADTNDLLHLVLYSKINSLLKSNHYSEVSQRMVLTL